MKHSLFKSFFACAILAIGSAPFTCSAHADEASDFSHSLTTDGAYYFKSDFQKGKDHFAKVTGPFDGILARTTWKTTYTIPTPLGENPLLAQANLELNGSFEFTPLSIRPIASISFSPLPFLVLEAGSSIGTGWNLLGFKGFCEYKNDSYKNLTPFSRYYHDHWLGATFQFDTGALIEGDWTHVILLANYQMIYRDVIGIDNGKLWAWQTTEGYVNGLGYEFIALLGYQMPKLVDLIGIMADMYGFYRNKDYGEYASTYGKFMRVDFNFLARLALNKINSITISTRIASRRSFATDHKKSEDEPHLLQTGREWHFDRIAFTWERKF